MNTKKPSAIVYGWHQLGEFVLESQIYWEENLFDEVFVYSLPYNGDVFGDYTKHNPDLIISFGENIEIPDYHLQKFHIHYDDMLDDVIVANVIVCQTVFRHTEYQRPRFSIFTPTYKTGDRIIRTYEGLNQQTFLNWEWVVVDDSPDEETWEILQEIASKDYRVKLHRIYPLSGVVKCMMMVSSNTTIMIGVEIGMQEKITFLILVMLDTRGKKSMVKPYSHTTTPT
jgi:hypothetical protein